MMKITKNSIKKLYHPFSCRTCCPYPINPFAGYASKLRTISEGRTKGPIVDAIEACSALPDAFQNISF